MSDPARDPIFLLRWLDADNNVVLRSVYTAPNIKSALVVAGTAPAPDTAVKLTIAQAEEQLTPEERTARRARQSDLASQKNGAPR